MFVFTLLQWLWAHLPLAKCLIPHCGKPKLDHKKHFSFLPRLLTHF